MHAKFFIAPQNITGGNIKSFIVSIVKIFNTSVETFPVFIPGMLGRFNGY